AQTRDKLLLVAQASCSGLISRSSYHFGQATPMVVMLNVHASRVSDLEQPDYVLTTPSVPLEGYRDSYGNWCNRLVAPTGTFSLRTEIVVRDSGQPDPADVAA